MNQRHFVLLARLCALAAGLFAIACGDGEDGSGENNGPATRTGEIEVAGTWNASAKGEPVGTETIDSKTWGFTHLVEFDNDENYAITQNPDDAMFGPGLYNRNVWTEPEAGTFYYCTDAFALGSTDDAFAAPTGADDTDPENRGCGGMFAWTKLSQ